MLHVSVSVAATRTELARGERLADLDDGFAVPVRLVCEHAEELRPTDIGDRFAELAVLLHVFHLQGLDADDVVVFDDPIFDKRDEDSEWTLVPLAFCMDVSVHSRKDSFRPIEKVRDGFV